MIAKGRSLRPQRRGFFLILVLVVVAVCTMAVYSFTELMVAYEDSTYLSADLVQARVNVESGVDTTRLLLSKPPATRLDYGGVFNNPSMFQAVNVSMGTDNATASSFTIVATGLTETGSYGGIRFGLQNESARLNLNALTALEENSDAILSTLLVTDEESEESEETEIDNIAVSLLMSLPGMSLEIADAILDWLDEDDEPRMYGAELESYTSLPTPYSPTNGPLLSVEELLLVRGITPALLFGADANRNGVLDADEQAHYGVGIETPGVLGWAAFLTVSGAEGNKTRDGLARVNVNQDDMELLYEELLEAIGDETYASYIVAYRIGGTAPNAEASGEAPEGADGGVWSIEMMDQVDLTGEASNPINQVLDLVGSTVTLGNGDNARTYASPFLEDPVSMALYLPVLMDVIATQDSETIPGRINLNECPAELLYGIPFLDEETIQAIIELRSTESDDPNRNFATWPLVEGIVTIEQMRSLTPLLTGGGDVYRAQIIGFFEDSGISSRSEVIIDATTVNPKVISWQNLSHLGRGFEQSVLGSRTMMNTDF
ncbi:General secretion pathway protein K [Novipirellula aureliae]|uniref:General secretion pathway protein K n=1 Tax=Novipirellula aureliae TaxID=2527966 RepID=A0A5C6E0H3_9BACT|nr:type II secretion system protein GspK [Novipirellula aureliae]TWU43183.1 General secretion pathway protein K [Novipirellula aureliae]